MSDFPWGNGILPVQVHIVSTAQSKITIFKRFVLLEKYFTLMIFLSMKSEHF